VSSSSSILLNINERGGEEGIRGSRNWAEGRRNISKKEERENCYE
jgi:hypothetical protein